MLEALEENKSNQESILHIFQKSNHTTHKSWTIFKKKSRTIAVYNLLIEQQNAFLNP